LRLVPVVSRVSHVSPAGGGGGVDGGGGGVEVGGGGGNGGGDGGDCGVEVGGGGGGAGQTRSPYRARHPEAEAALAERASQEDVVEGAASLLGSRG
jgi:hypothetical protein